MRIVAHLSALGLLLLFAGAVAADYASSRATDAPGRITIGEGRGPAGIDDDDDAPSVARTCGFAPCGMPLPCD